MYEIMLFCIVIQHSNPTFIIFVGKIVQTLIYRYFLLYPLMHELMNHKVKYNIYLEIKKKGLKKGCMFLSKPLHEFLFT